MMSLMQEEQTMPVSGGGTLSVIRAVNTTSSFVYLTFHHL